MEKKKLTPQEILEQARKAKEKPAFKNFDKVVGKPSDRTPWRRVKSNS